MHIYSDIVWLCIRFRENYGRALTFQRFGYLVAVRIISTISIVSYVGTVAFNTEIASIIIFLRARSRLVAIVRSYSVSFRRLGFTSRSLLLLFFGGSDDKDASFDWDNGGDDNDDKNDENSNWGVGDVAGDDNGNVVYISMYTEGILADSGVVGNTFGESVGDNDE